MRETAASTIDLGKQNNTLAVLFSEELGLVIEYLPTEETKIFSILDKAAVPYQVIGKTTPEKRIAISLRTPNSELRTVLDEDMLVLRDIWEETSHQLDLMQRNPENIREERKNIYDRKGPSFVIHFTPKQTAEDCFCSTKKPKVAVIREEGSNGDREMVSAFFLAGFEPWDVTVTDLLEGRITLDRFRGIVFVGGFSYADVLDSAKGWAASIRFNKKVWDQFEKFYHRPDTFSLGVCNGCQLMALLGWVPWRGIADELQPRFIHNKSGRFESRFSTVKILKSPSIMLNGMENSVLGIWVAHGEGLAYFPDKKMFNECEHGLAPIRYVDDESRITETYPFNPNGSPAGIAGLCSPDGTAPCHDAAPRAHGPHLAVGLAPRRPQEVPRRLSLAPHVPERARVVREEQVTLYNPRSADCADERRFAYEEFVPIRVSTIEEVQFDPSVSLVPYNKES